MLDSSLSNSGTWSSLEKVWSPKSPPHKKKRSHVRTKRSNKKMAKKPPPDRSSGLVFLFDLLLVFQIGQRDPLLGPKISTIMKFG